MSKGENAVTEIYYAGLMEFNDMAFLLHFLRSGEIFIDIGANSGTFSVLASFVPGARVIAFEPNHDATTRLRKNLQLNNVTSEVEVREKTLGNLAGSILMKSDLDTTNQVSIF